MPETSFTATQLATLKGKLEEFRAGDKKERAKIIKQVHTSIVGAQGRSETPLEYKASGAHH
jgi:hypothetical protein